MGENEKIEEEKTVEENETTKVVENVVTEEIPNDNQENDSKAFSISSLVLGIVAFFVSKTGLIALTCAILAIIFGVKGQKRAGKGMAKAGFILGIVYISIYVVVLIVLMSLLGVGLGAALLSA